MIPVRIARILYAARIAVRSAVAVATILAGIGIAVQCSGCATAGKVASVLEPVARVSCAIARKVVTACDVAFPETAEDATCPPDTAGDEAP